MSPIQVILTAYPMEKNDRHSYPMEKNDRHIYPMEKNDCHIYPMEKNDRKPRRAYSRASHSHSRFTAVAKVVSRERKACATAEEVYFRPPLLHACTRQ